MPYDYGDYAYLCRNIPSLALCNLFVAQQLRDGASESIIFGDVPRSDAGVGVNSTCAILRLDVGSSQVGNVANIIVCGLSVFIALFLAWRSGKRVAAVGKEEMRVLCGIYALTCVFQLFTTGSFITQGSTALAWLTAVHVGLVVTLFWVLLWIAILTLQVVEDGRSISLILLIAPSVILFIGSAYISLDIAFSVSDYFRTSIDSLHSAWLFSLTTIWPAVSIAAFLVINAFVSLRILKEGRPVLLYLGTLAVFALAEAGRYALSHRICTGTDAHVDGSFLGTMLETTTLVLLFFSWRSITEDTWDEADSVAYLS